MDATTIKSENLKMWQLKDLSVTKKEIKKEEPNTSKIPISQNYVTVKRCSPEEGNLFWDVDFSNLNHNEDIKIGIGMCRVCLKQGTIPIHGKGPGEDFSSALRTCGGIDVNIFDSYPKYLCESCHSLLQSAILLRKTAQSSEQLFKKTISKLPILDNIDNDAHNIKTTDDTGSNMLDDNDDNFDYKSDTDVDETPGNVTETPYVLEPQIYVKKDNAHDSFTKTTQLDLDMKIIDNPSLKDASSVKDDFTCKKCDVKFDSFQQYRLHKLSLIKHKKRECTKCKQRYAVRCVKITNKKTKKAERSYVCGICYETVDKVIDKPEANNFDIGDVKKAKQEQKTKKSVLNCKLCDVEFDTFDDYEEHKIRTHRHMRNICGVCKKRVAVRYVKKYLKTANKKGVYMCNVCYTRESITVVKELKRKNVSREIAVKLKPKLKCNVCDVTFSSRQEGKLHNVQHREEKISCKICNKVFRPYYMRTHMLTHNVPSYVCDICGKQFKQQPSLIYHTRIHSDELPYKCSICPYRTRLSGSLRIHMRMHTGEKPYQCEECPKKFVTKSNLNKHSFTHKAGYRFICECGKGYRGKLDLESHIRVVHTGIKDYVCEICDKAFTVKKKLMSHQINVHKREKLRSGKQPVYLAIDNMKKQEINTNDVENKTDATL